MLPTDALGWLSTIVKHGGPLFSMIVGCLCVYSLQKVIILRSTPLFFIIRVLMLLDIINIIVSKIHDIPDDFANRELFDAVSITVVLIVACIRWFAQLLALPILSILHFMSVFRPVRFRKLHMVHGYALTGLFLCLSMLLTAPLLTECCGFTYYVNGAFWAFDFAKPGTALYTQMNLILQGFCVIIMLICDVLILYKVWNMRINSMLAAVQHSCFPCLDPAQHLAISDHSHTVTVLSESHSTVRQTRQVRFEKRLTASFLLLSLSFILPTIGFNLRPVYQQWAVSDLIGAVCLWVEYSKWFTYSLTTTLIRKEFVKIVKCQRTR